MSSALLLPLTHPLRTTDAQLRGVRSGGDGLETLGADHSHVVAGQANGRDVVSVYILLTIAGGLTASLRCRPYA